MHFIFYLGYGSVHQRFREMSKILRFVKNFWLGGTPSAVSCPSPPTPIDTIFAQLACSLNKTIFWLHQE